METLTYKGYEFASIYSCTYATVFYNRDLKFTICRADAEYIPLEEFKSIFLAVTELIAEYPMKSMLFDKRNLRTFHQPSMEWYFIVWKPAIKQAGLTNHFKILPDLEWFIQSVNAGRHQITLKCDKDLLDGIQIRYVEDVEDAIRRIEDMQAAENKDLTRPEEEYVSEQAVAEAIRAIGRNEQKILATIS